jgi:hypothetical protein
MSRTTSKAFSRGERRMMMIGMEMVNNTSWIGYNYYSFVFRKT